MIVIIAGYDEQDIKLLIDAIFKKEGRKIFHKTDANINYETLSDGNLELEIDDELVDGRKPTKRQQVFEYLLFQLRARQLDVYIPVLIDSPDNSWKSKISKRIWRAADFYIHQSSRPRSQLVSFVAEDEKRGMPKQRIAVSRQTAELVDKKGKKNELE